jgi:hypothetical protein
MTILFFSPLNLFLIEVSFPLHDILIRLIQVHAETSIYSSFYQTNIFQGLLLKMFHEYQTLIESHRHAWNHNTTLQVRII